MRRLVLIVVLAAISMGSRPSIGGAQTSDISGLTGIKSLVVIIEELPPGATRLGVTDEMIRTDVELKLRLAGIPVLTAMDHPYAPALHIEINALDDSAASYVEVDLEQNAKLERNGAFIPLAITWSHGILIQNPSGDFIRDRLKDFMDRFLNEWLAANPTGRRSP